MTSLKINWQLQFAVIDLTDPCGLSQLIHLTIEVELLPIIFWLQLDK